ncbi:MAG: hypothetical protein DCO95_02515 [Roseivirga sp. XM-24bin3]|nr:MAG: hypothetical protein DCO95_02515 [Roseivirga sp. XM-24bin3]
MKNMKHAITRKALVLFSLCLLPSLTNAQTFQGTIDYKIEMMNPNPEIISDSLWQASLKESLGERGYIIQKYFYSGENYASEISAGKENGFQVFNPKDKLIYSWQADSDTATTLDSRKSFDSFIEMAENEDTEDIMGIQCKSITIKTKFGTTQIWYNNDYLKVDPKSYQGHIYGQYSYITERIKCHPLKTEMTGIGGHIISTVIDFEAVEIDSEKFKIPDFKFTIPNPIN